jgi:exopolysaccharide biosynthesis protein
MAYNKSIQWLSFLILMVIVFWGFTQYAHAMALEVENQMSISVAAGIKYTQIRGRLPGGPVLINLLQVDGIRSAITVKPVLAQDSVTGKERASQMTERVEALAAVNGGFFGPDGRPLGLLMIDGTIIAEPLFNRSALGITSKGEFAITNPNMEAFISGPDGSVIDISGMNRPLKEGEVLIYHPIYGRHFLENSVEDGLVILDDKVIDIWARGKKLPEGAYVIAGSGDGSRVLDALNLGDRVSLHIELIPDWPIEGVIHALGGGPRLIRDGQVHITSEEESFKPDVALGRAPRTAAGITKRGELLLVVVNGRSPGVSIGMTLKEMAEFMLWLGATDALNLDGGGSATMAIRGRSMNLPSDGQERLVSSGIAVTRK